MFWFSHLKIVDDVSVDVLDAVDDLQLKLSHEFLFLLCQHNTGKATLAQLMQLGITAFKRLQQHCSIHGHSGDLINVEPEDVECSRLEDKIAILGCMPLSALAVYVDNQVFAADSTDLQTRECKRMAAVTDIIDLLLQNWIDPVIATVVLAEVKIL